MFYFCKHQQGRVIVFFLNLIHNYFLNHNPNRCPHCDHDVYKNKLRYDTVVPRSTFTKEPNIFGLSLLNIAL